MFDISAVNKSRALRWHPAGIASWSWSDWACALGGEVGEILEVIEENCLAQHPVWTKLSDMQAHRTQWRESLAGEIADSYTYLDLFCTATHTELVLCRERAGATLHYRYDEFSLIGMAVSAAADCGKLQDIVKKLNRERDGLAGNRQTPFELWGALADRIGLLGNKLDRLAAIANLDLFTCVRDKFNVVSCRMGLPERL